MHLTKARVLIFNFNFWEEGGTDIFYSTKFILILFSWHLLRKKGIFKLYTPGLDSRGAASQSTPSGPTR